MPLYDLPPHLLILEKLCRFGEKRDLWEEVSPGPDVFCERMGASNSQAQTVKHAPIARAARGRDVRMSRQGDIDGRLGRAN